METLSLDVMDSVSVSEKSRRSPLIGIGQAPCHHGELLQGVFEEQNGVRSRGLVSFIHGHLKSQARYIHSNQSSTLDVFPRHKKKALRAAELTLGHLGEEVRGTISIESMVEEELGLGSSTADVIAAIRAVSNSFGHVLSREQIAKIAIQAEFASDPIMYESYTVLFAQREGRVIEELGPPIPRVGVISFTLGETINTCTYQAPEYTWEDLQEFKPLLGLLRHGLTKGDLNIIAKVTTHSAIINQKYVPKPFFDDVLNLSNSAGLLGLQIAHSGNIVGLMVDPSDPDLSCKITESRYRLSELGIENINYFETK